MREFLQQREYLCLHGHVERGRRFIGDDEPRPTSERHGDHHALTHAAGEVVRIVSQPAHRIGNRDLGQQLSCLFEGIRPSSVAVLDNRFGDLLADGEHRIQRRHGFLEDHCHAIAAYCAHVSFIEFEQITILENDLASLDPPRIADEPHDGECRHTLARAALADDRECFTRVHV